jgi:hypothetical protein
MLKKLLKLGTPTKLPTVEEWSQRHANKASADGIIAACIVESLAKNWEDWVATGLEEQKGHRSHFDAKSVVGPRLVNKKKKITVEFGVRTYKYKDIHEYTRWASDWQSAGTKVNGIEIELKAARYVAAGYERIAKQQQALQEQAARSKAAMEANEQKWNLAEQLLGFKRTAEGALVPSKEVTA